MKPLRLMLCFFTLTLLAQAPEPNNAARIAHAAYNVFGILANKWTDQHDDLIWSKADHERLEQTRAAWKTFDRLSREAKF